MNIDELTRAATVPILGGAGQLLGSGFFISPGTLLTAAHVHDKGAGGPVFACVNGTDHAVASFIRLPKQMPPGLDLYPLPDICVMKLRQSPEEEPECVELGHAIPQGLVAAYGFSRGIENQTIFSADMASLQCDGTRQEQGVLVLKFRDAFVDGGMSGGPLLDPDLGVVVGITKATRDPSQPYGCYGVSAQEIERRFPSVWSENVVLHRRRQVWRAAKIGIDGVSPTTAAWALGSALSKNIERQVVGLPFGVTREGLHQAVWVRRQPEGQENQTFHRFRWDVAKSLPLLTVITGKPGAGKSWLLANEANRLARLLMACESESDVDNAHIPAIMDCTAFAALQLPDGKDGISALTLLGLPPGMLSGVKSSAVEALYRKAYEEGRLRFLLDGLDELPASTRGEFTRRLSGILSNGNKVVVTSRPGSASLLEGFSHGDRDDLALVEFQDSQIFNFIHAWQSDSPAKGEALLGAIRTSSQLRQLAETPLLLSFLCRAAGTDLALAPLGPSTTHSLVRAVILQLLSGRQRGPAMGGTPTNDSAPDAVARLDLLADAFGKLEDHWRGSRESEPRQELLGAIRTHPLYEDLKETARLRLEDWTTVARGPARVTAIDPVLWEYVFDGLLAEAPALDQSRRIRVIHPLLRQFLLAHYFSRLPELERLACVDRHRWFDPDWQAAIIDGCADIADPRSLLDALIDHASDDDLWVSQAGLAARCLVGSRSRPSPIAERLLDLLVLSCKSPLLVERSRALETLLYLIESGLPEAETWATEQLQTWREPAAWDQFAQEIATSVVALGHEPSSVRLARHLFALENLSHTVRLRLISALVDNGDSESVICAFEELQAIESNEALASFLASVGRGGQTALECCAALLRTSRLRADAARLVAATVVGQGEAGPALLTRLARDGMVPWRSRVSIMVELIASGHLETVQLALEMSNNPNIPIVERANLVMALLESNQDEALPQAADMIFTSGLSWATRKGLSRALAGLGPAGVQLLSRQFYLDGFDLSAKFAHLDVLVEVGHAKVINDAILLQAEEGLPASARAQVALILARRNRSLVNEQSLTSLLDDSHLSDSLRESIIRVLLELDGKGAEFVAASVIDEAKMGRITTLHRPGRGSSRKMSAILQQIAMDEAMDSSLRCEAVLQLSDLGAAELRELVAAVGDSLPPHWRTRLLLGLGRVGYAPDLAGFIEVVENHLGGYRVLYEYLAKSSDVSEELLPYLLDAARNCRRYGEQHATTRDGGSEVSVALNEDFLRDLQIEFSSKAESDRQLRWIYEKLEWAVGLNLTRVMVPEQLDEFEAFVNSGDEDGALEWLTWEMPEYRAVVHETLSQLRSSVLSGRLQVPRLASNSSNIPPMEQIAHLASQLASWVASAERRDLGEWTKQFDALSLESGSWRRSAAIRLLELGAEIDPSWPMHEGHLYAVRECDGGDSGTTRWQRLADRSLEDGKILLDRGDFVEAFHAASFTVLWYPEEAAGYFYASLSASALSEMRPFALRLMCSSGRLASAGQVQTGLASLLEFGPRLGWGAEYAAAMRSSLLGDEGGGKE